MKKYIWALLPLLIFGGLALYTSMVAPGEGVNGEQYETEGISDGWLITAGSVTGMIVLCLFIYDAFEWIEKMSERKMLDK